MNYFHNTPKLKTVIIAPSVKNLCERLFEYSYEGLENVYFPDTLDEIASSFLAETYSLRNVRFPKQINTIGQGAFFGTGMKRIVLPESLTVIADYAFRCVYDCHYMEIGKNVKIIGAAAFGTMDKLDTLVIRATTPPLTGTNAFQYTNERKITFLVPKKSLELYRKDSVYRTLNPQPMEQ
ncbi:MAG: leucine-rich repeat protein [Bacteroidales bacterium]|nr:leucine-rich repeat protein [Bacteroidales bacterium]